MWKTFTRIFLLTSFLLFPILCMPALAKENGNDEEMAEMIASEIKSLSNELIELEEKLKVST